MHKSFLTSALISINAAHNIWDTIVEPIFTNPFEARVFDYFCRFIFTISVHLLCKLLQFVTGKPNVACSLLKLVFVFLYKNLRDVQQLTYYMPACTVNPHLLRVMFPSMYRLGTGGMRLRGLDPGGRSRMM